MKGWCDQFPALDFAQKTLKKRNPSEVEAESGVFEVVYLEILPNRLEVQFPRPVLISARVFHFWLNPKDKTKRNCKQTMNTQFEIQ